MRNRLGGLVAVAVLGAGPQAWAAPVAFASLHPVSGDVVLAGSSATLHLGSHFFYYQPEEAKGVMVRNWGYDAADVANVRGLILPAQGEGEWAAIVTYKVDGHVDDIYAGIDNSDEIHSAELAAEPDINTARRELNLPTLSVQEWIQKPAYDKASHTLVWSRRLAVGSDGKRSVLEADVAVLTRNGVLLFDINSDMAHAKQIAAATVALAKVATFAPGARYQDYREGGDRVAKYDTIGLIENEVGVPVEGRKSGWDQFKEAWGVLTAIFAAALAAVSWLFRKVFPKKAA